ncbi:pyruvate dehydrogenase, decarboxylase component E1, thiamin-binding [Georgfuchsia toluolica]|uniref:Pyruvate dehydrogenase E1 component n=1 Tax=Georgfuchsia toluolica TaxID=424218 RepID=A0A916N1B4_9PROT|nr:pyruvate dehydrogenase (acetyl-transferring), homodimeric type [Georgfuchsia toluolica]CAG4884738.1 pyruvate dehydrogenase, decarboxylase component E1, thiamin-binding [Georgfuchsia toluolica]
MDIGDPDPVETQEWLDSIQSVLEHEGAARARYLIERLSETMHRSGVDVPMRRNTPYVNTIPADQQERSPGNPDLEQRIRSYVRWNALAMVVHANRHSSELGGHIASFASSATLYGVGGDHFFHAPSEHHGGDLVYYQGHSAPGFYARAFLEGNISEAQLRMFRREVGGGGLSSYPHPWLMPDFWQFSTVSMGLGAIQAIYQARFMKYLQRRGIANTEARKVWTFLGDGEMDEPESLGAISLASRDSLDNLIFVINCNLQRLDGPVRGNGKIIQELEAVFRGAGWNVIKVIWGGYWDPLLAKDSHGLLLKRMEEAVDGDYQNYKAKDGAYVRQHFFGKYPELLDMVADMSDEDIWRLNRGGHDPHKVYAAYAAAVKHTGQPTVILAKTVKGYGMGRSGQAQNIAHQQKKMAEPALKAFRDRFKIPIPDEKIEEVPFYKPSDDSPEMRYLMERVKARGGFLPTRRRQGPALDVPDLSAFELLLRGTEDREMSTTMAYVRILAALLRDKHIGKLVVPIVPDEARTFGMEGLFRQVGIYSSVGQHYEPQDASQLTYYREDEQGQILQEGISEAGAFCSWIAAATAYSTHGTSMIPFFSYYSMFGFHRFGDLAWAAADMCCRGFLMGGTAGATTLAGEGLQHQDGHSHLMAATIPTCVSYDPAFAYELAVIVHDGLRRMYREQENVFYYITMMNENYRHPPLPAGSEEGIIKGMYLFSQGQGKGAAEEKRVQLLGSGTILREVIAAGALLEADFGVVADVWSVTSFTELRREGLECERWNMLHPGSEARMSYVERCLRDRAGPVIAAADYMKAYADQIRAFVPRRYKVLGTDGFGRSDTRRELRRFFEVDRHHIVVAALTALVEDKQVSGVTVTEAIRKYEIDPETPDPARS